MGKVAFMICESQFSNPFMGGYKTLMFAPKKLQILKGT